MPKKEMQSPIPFRGATTQIALLLLFIIINFLYAEKK
ncbi:hypothetical protein MCEME17_00909 [Candidatus Pelagibacterales bacterium]